MYAMHTIMLLSGIYMKFYFEGNNSKKSSYKIQFLELGFYMFF